VAGKGQLLLWESFWVVEAPSHPTAGQSSGATELLDRRTVELAAIPLSCCLPSTIPAQLMPLATSWGCSVCPSQCKHYSSGNIMIYPEKRRKQQNLQQISRQSQHLYSSLIPQIN